MDAQDRGTLATSIAVEGDRTITGPNELLRWRIDVTCSSDAVDCGNVIVRDDISAGQTLVSIDTVASAGFDASTLEPTDVSRPTIVEFSRPTNLVHGETVTILMTTRVTEAALVTGEISHLVTTASTNATPPTSAVGGPIQATTQPRWEVRQLVDETNVEAGSAPAPIAVGVNTTHPVALCGSTVANLGHDALSLELELPNGVVVVEADEATLTPTGLVWDLAPVDQFILATEHDSDTAAGRVGEYCHERFPILRWPAATFVPGATATPVVTAIDTATATTASICASACESTPSLAFAYPATDVRATAVGPPTVDPRGMQTWQIGLDASLASDAISLPMLDVALPPGLQVHDLVVPFDQTGAAAPVQIYVSTSGGDSYLAAPVDPSPEGVVDRAAIDEVAGSGVPVDGLQVRWTSATDDGTDPAIAPASVAVFDLRTRSNPAIPTDQVGQLCVAASAANAAPTDGSGATCAGFDFVTSGPLLGVGASTEAASGPTVEQRVQVTLELPIENGAAIEQPTISELLPAGFSFVRFDSIEASPQLGAVPAPWVEIIEDFEASGQDLVRFRWTSDADGASSAHTFQWSAAERATVDDFVPAAVTVNYWVVADAGTAAGPHDTTIDISSAIAAPAGCVEPAVLADDAAARVGSAPSCSLVRQIDIADAAAAEAASWGTAEVQLDHVALDGSSIACPARRIDDVDYTAPPCAAAAVPNGKLGIRTLVDNVGNRDLSDQWVYGLLPRPDASGITPTVFDAPPASAWAGSLAGPVQVQGLAWEPDVRPEDVVIEYSQSREPCRPEIGGSGTLWPAGCVDDWTANPADWALVTAWRVHVPFDRVALLGGEGFAIDWELVAAADAEFASFASAQIASAAYASAEGVWARTEGHDVAFHIPAENDIIVVDPGLLPYDLALTAAIDRTAPDLGDGVLPGDRVVTNVRVLNQGSPVQDVEIALHLGAALAAAVSETGTEITSDGGSVSWSVDGSVNPTKLAIRGQIGRGDDVVIPVQAIVGDAWAGEPIELVAEISNFDADGLPGGGASSGEIVDHDSTPDLDPDNDVAPEGPRSPGDDVTSGDGLADTGAEPDPVADDEDDHDVAGVPIWDLAVELDMAEGQSPNLDWATRTAHWAITVTNEGRNAAYGVTIDNQLPAGMAWSAFDSVATTGSQATAATVTSTGVAGETGPMQFTIDVIEPGASVTWTSTTTVSDTTIATFANSVSLSSFDSKAEGDGETNEPDPLAVDWDQGDDGAASATTWLPYDVSVEIRHEQTSGLPVQAGLTVIDAEVTVGNDGRPVDSVMVVVPVPEGFVAAAPDLTERTFVDQQGRPMRVAWDLANPLHIRIQVSRTDGTPMVYGDHVAVPVRIMVSDASVNLIDRAIEAAIESFSPATDDDGTDGAEGVGDVGLVEAAIDVEPVDVDPNDDIASVEIPVWDLALDVTTGDPLIRAIDGEVVAAVTITVTNEGNQVATAIDVAALLPDGTSFAGVGAESGATTAAAIGDEGTIELRFPTLAAGESASVDLYLGFTAGWEATFTASAQITGFGDDQAPSAETETVETIDGADVDIVGDTDSRAGSLDLAALVQDPTLSVEDDEAVVTFDVPIALDLAVAHVETERTGRDVSLTTATFDVTVVNSGRPVDAFDLVVAESIGFAPLSLAENPVATVRADSGAEFEAVWSTGDDGQPGVQLTGLDGASLQIGESITIPVTLPVADVAPVIEIAAGTDIEAESVIAVMATWDLALSMERAPGQSEQLDPSQGPISWIVTVENQGREPAHRIVIEDRLPVGMALESFNGAAEDAVTTQLIGEPEVGGLFAIEVDRLHPGGVATISLTTTLVSAAQREYVHAAEIVSFDDDADPTNPRDARRFDIDSNPRDDLPVAAAPLAGFSLDLDQLDDGTQLGSLAAQVDSPESPDEDDLGVASVSLDHDLAVGLTVDAGLPATAGSTLQLTLSVTNQGPDIAQADIGLDLPSGVWQALDAAANPDGTTTGDAALGYVWTIADAELDLIGPLLAGQTVTVPIVVTVGSPSATPSGLVVAAAIGEFDDDGDPVTPAPDLVDADGDATASLLLSTYDLAITKRLDPSTALPVVGGTSVTFWIEVINQGSTSVSDIVVLDTIDPTHWVPFDAALNPGSTSVGQTQLAYAWSDVAGNGSLSLTGALPAGSSLIVPFVVTLAGGADPSAARNVVEIAGATPLAADGVTAAADPAGNALVDFDSVSDLDPTNDAQPANPTDVTDDAVDNADGDEDDHDIAGLVAQTWSLGNQVWFDDDESGLIDNGETGAAGVSVELYADADSDGVADDPANPIASVVTDAGGLYLFQGVAQGNYVISIPASQFESGAALADRVPTASVADPNTDIDGDNNGVASNGGAATGTIVVGAGAPLGESPNNDGVLPDSRSNLTIDMGFRSEVGFAIGNRVMVNRLDADGNGTLLGRANVTMYLAADADGDGAFDDLDGDGEFTAADAVAVTTTDGDGYYLFSGLAAGDYLVIVGAENLSGSVINSASIGKATPVWNVPPPIDIDADSNAVQWLSGGVVSDVITIGDGEPLGEPGLRDAAIADENDNLAVDFVFTIEWLPVTSIDLEFPVLDPGFFGPSSSTIGGGESFNGFGGADPLVGGPSGGFDDFSGGSDSGPGGPLAYSGSSARELASWGLMMLAIGALLVGVSKDPDED